MLKRVAIFVYGCLSYLVFLGTFLYAIAFVGDFVVPTRLDGTPVAPLGTSLAIDLALLTLFAVQHSVMARRGFKAWWTRIVPAEIERSTYVLCASAALLLLFSQWHPLGGHIWQIQSAAGRAALGVVFACGWTLVLVATFLINHFDLFGLRQVWFALRGKPYAPVSLATPWLYRLVRHPLYLGFLLAFWATPNMTLAHLVFAVATTAYIRIAIQLEERDLVAEHGLEYETYRRRVPMLLPRTRAAGASVSGGQLAARGVVSKHLLVLIVPMLTVLGLESSSAAARHEPPQIASVALEPLAPRATPLQGRKGDRRQPGDYFFSKANQSR